MQYIRETQENIVLKQCDREKLTEETTKGHLSKKKQIKKKDKTILK